MAEPRSCTQALAAGLWTALTLAAAPVLAQDVQDLASRCAGGALALEAVCREGALAFEAAHGGMGLLASGGAQVPGAASTLGRRFGGEPRVSGSLRASFARFHLPDVRVGGTPTFQGRSPLGFAAQGSVALGLFEGFSLVPTVGGVLSVDVFATAGFLLLPGGHGFRTHPAAWGVGAKVGLIRESFTLPGVTVSAARRSVGAASLGDRAAGHAAEMEVDPVVMSLRGTVGKDLLAVGVLGGVGWERLRSSGTLAVSGPGGATGQAAVSGFTSSRFLLFGGLSLTFLVLQLSTELGWAGGFDAFPGRPAGGYDPGRGSFFLSAASRVTL